MSTPLWDRHGDVHLESQYSGPLGGSGGGMSLDSRSLRPAWAANVTPLCSFLLFYPKRRNLKEGGVLLGPSLRGERPSWRGKNGSRNRRQLATLSSRRRADKMWSRAVHPQGSTPPRDVSSIKAPPPKDSTIVQKRCHQLGSTCSNTQAYGGTLHIHTAAVSEKRKQTKQVNLLSWSLRVYISFSLLSDVHIAELKTTPSMVRV